MLELKQYMSSLNIPKNEILKDTLLEIVMKEKLQKEYSAETKILHEVMPHLFQNAMLMDLVFDLLGRSVSVDQIINIVLM
jgi:hypothetical protein